MATVNFYLSVFSFLRNIEALKEWDRSSRFRRFRWLLNIAMRDPKCARIQCVTHTDWMELGACSLLGNDRVVNSIIFRKRKTTEHTGEQIIIEKSRMRTWCSRSLWNFHRLSLESQFHYYIFHILIFGLISQVSSLLQQYMYRQSQRPLHRRKWL